MTKPRSKEAKSDNIDSANGLSRFNRHHLPWDRFSKNRKLNPLAVRPSIVANNLDLSDIARNTWRAIGKLNHPPFLFRHEGRLSRIEADDTGAPKLVFVDVQRMHFQLVKLINWVKRVKTKSKGRDVSVVEISTRPPRDIAAHLVADPDPPVPQLQRIVTTPLFTAEGKLLKMPGEYADSVLYLPPKNFRLAALPSRPGEADIQAAVHFLKHNLMNDFCLVGDSEVANCFAALLTPLVREMISGPTPLIWTDKSIGGSGGTLLSSVIASWFQGAEPTGVTAPHDEAEWTRVILSTLRRSPNVFFIDNCNRPLSSEALAHAITAARYEGRIIGSSNNESAEVKCLWLINGNNLQLGWELARRAVRIRMNPPVVAGETDSRNFTHPDLLTWVIQNRAQIAFHLIVLVKAWQAKACPGPAAGTPSFASFDSWREIVGGIINVAGIGGFLCNLGEARLEADQESADLRAFLDTWLKEFGYEPVFTTDLLPIARHLFDFQGSEHSTSVQLGKLLSKYHNQVYGGSLIRRMSASEGKTRWRLQRAAM